MLYFSSKNNTDSNLRQDIATNCVDGPLLQNSPILFSNEPQHFLHNAKLLVTQRPITKNVRKLWQNWAEHCRIKETTSTAATHKLLCTMNIQLFGLVYPGRLGDTKFHADEWLFITFWSGSITSKNATYFWTFPEGYQGSMISNVNLFSIMINVFKSTNTSNVFVFAPKR